MTKPPSPAKPKAISAKSTQSKASQEVALEQERQARDERVTRGLMRPSVNAAFVMEEFGKSLAHHDVGVLIDGLSEGIGRMADGDMSRPEAMLFAQAHSLQTMFVVLARRANQQTTMNNTEAFMRMALKAQNQCRMTLETLATLKNPPVVIARQANINNGGQQQVNNGPPPEQAAHPPKNLRGRAQPRAHATKTKSEKTELLESQHEQRLDTRAPRTAGSTDPNLETVGTVHRPAK
jgi:hypothetical protein